MFVDLHHYHKHQRLEPLIRFVSKVTTALSNVSSVFQLFSFLVICSSMISKGFGFVGIKGWYWPQGLLSMQIDNVHKSWETSSDMISVSSASKSDFLTSSIVIPGHCDFSCSREVRMKASSRRLKTAIFGMFGGPEVS